MSVGEFAVVTGIAELDNIIMYIIVALIICGINSLLIPFVNWVLDKLKNSVKKLQKTPEDDGELADKFLDKIEAVRKEFISSMNNLENKLVENKKETDDRIDNVITATSDELKRVDNNQAILNGKCEELYESISDKEPEQELYPKLAPVEFSQENANKITDVPHNKNNLFGGDL